MSISSYSERYQNILKLPMPNRKLFQNSVIKNVMRIGIVTIILLVSTSIQLLIASPLKSQPIDQVTIHIGLNNETLIQAFQKIEAQSLFHFMFNNEEVKDFSNLKVKDSRQTVKEFLQTILANTSLTYRQVNNQIFIKAVKSDFQNPIALSNSGNENHQYQAVANIVTGQVTNAKGEPLAGVSVTVKGATGGTSTNGSGNYTIDIPAKGTLVFSYVGYATREMPVNNRSGIDIVMEESVSGMDEIVVVGYGTQKKVNLTGSVSQIDFTQDLLNRPITNASQALSGKVPGLWAMQNSGQPGSDGTLLRIRGWGSLNSAGPLVIIDGAQGSLEQLNPQDIKSITVLKDAASASIYGSKAANGVIIINTKSGDNNKKPQIKLSSYYGFSSIGLNYDRITNSATLMEIWNQAEINNGKAKGPFPDSVINAFRNNSDPYLYPNTDFDDYIYQNAPIWDNNLSFSGGSENSKYYLSFNHQTQDGMIRSTSSGKYGMTLNVETKVKSWIKIGGRFNTRIKKSRELYDNERIAYVWSNGGYPFIAPYTKDGRPGGVQALNNSGNQIVSNRNPVVELFNGWMKSNDYLVRSTVYADITLLKGLELNTNFTTRLSHSLTDKYNPGLLDGYLASGKVAPNLGAAGYGKYIATRASGTNIRYSGFSNLNYSKSFNKHDLSALAGMQVDVYENKTVFARSEEAPALGITQVSGGTTRYVANGNLVGNRMLSYFGRVNYAFADKYLFEFNIRADGSSRFIESKRWGVFSGVSMGWRIIKEEFMKGQNLFSDLKIRSSYGKLGNQEIGGNYPYLSTLSQTIPLSYTFNGAMSPGVAMTSLVNEQITWETTAVNDIGLEMSFLQNKLRFEATVFNKTTEGIIVSLPMPRTVGVPGAPYENIGKMSNKGVEFEISYSKREANRKKFDYNLSANFTYVVNKVTKFLGGKSPDQLYLIREGYSYKSLYAWNAIGIFQTDKEASDYMHSNGYLPTAGDIKYEDVNGDGKLDYQDKKVLGNSIPKIHLGGDFDFSYQGFNLSLSMAGISGVTVNYNDRWSMPLGATGGTVTKRWLNAWTPDNPSTELPKIKLNDSWNLRRSSSFWAHDLTYLKIRNVQLSYTFQKNSKLLKKTDLNVYCNLQNYFTFVNKGYEGFDPEKNVFLKGDTGERGLSDVYPMPKIITAGFNLTF